jgi:acyl-homoserine-lactone acylase
MPRSDRAPQAVVVTSPQSGPRRGRARTVVHRCLGALACLAALAAVVTTPAQARTSEPFAAIIRYTEYGIPHILATGNAGLGYGIGYAQARDAVCVLADAYLTVDGERSRYFGADANYELGGSDVAPNRINNLASDLYFAQLIASGEVQRLATAPAPAGPSAQAHQLVRGFVAGYNRYLRDTGVDRISDPSCRGAAWVRPITEATMWRSLFQVSTLASSVVLIDAIAAAQPPAAQDAGTPNAAGVLPDLDRSGIGSNAIAVGSEATTNGRAVMLASPHFPWQGRLRMWQMHLTVPGQLDVAGTGLLGVPVVTIGHTRGVAWSHTVSVGRRFTPYQLTLAPGSPTSYLVDGRPEPMTSRTVSITVRAADGTLGTVSRTLWSTRYGPVVTGVPGLPLPWTATRAFAVRDANAGNLRLLDTWLGFARAGDTDGVLHALRTTQGVPWVNTLAADHRGRALYTDFSVVPHVTDELAARCNTPTGAAIFPVTGLPLLDGSRSDCAWGADSDAIQPGTFGPARLPVQERRDYVLNSNNSPWLSNVHAPLTGYPRIVGDVATARSLRTRMAHLAVAERLAGTDGLPGTGFDRRSMEQVVLADRGLAAELVADEAAAMCRNLPGGTAPSASGPVDVTSACRVLEAWDHHYDVDSRGAVLFTRFWQRALAVPGGPWTVPFDPARPVDTPRGLATAKPELHRALGDAVADLAAQQIPVDAAPGDVQQVADHDRVLRIHGGPESDGILNKITTVRDSLTGRLSIGSGSTFIQVTAFTGGACPDVRTIMTYSQSPDPTSPHHLDQTRLFAEKRWVTERFCERDIAAAPGLRTVPISESR